MKTKFFRKINQRRTENGERGKVLSPAGHLSAAKRRLSRVAHLSGLLLFLFPLSLFAQNGVSVSNFVAGTGAVTFDVSWNKATIPTSVWSDTVWVFVDYNKAGVMTRLPLRTGSTLINNSAPGVG
jgi:hypothetical protein